MSSNSSDAAVHPPALRALCSRVIEVLRALEAAPPTERTEPLEAVRAALREVDAEVKRLDLGKQVFNDEQGDLIAAGSAVAAIELDRGGPRVPRYVAAAVAAMERIAAL